MLVIKKVTKLPDGTFVADWRVTEEQMAYLLTYALNKLIVEGVVDVDIEPENYQEQLELEFIKATEAGAVQ
jgi:hypothetical protein